MPGLDELISNSLAEIIKRNLDSGDEKKLKMQLFQKHGLSIKQAIQDFSKINEILKNLLKTDVLSFEEICLREIISLKMNRNSVAVTIKDKKLKILIIEILGDEEYRNIIESTLEKALLISEIIETCKLSKTSGYRKISYLIRNGFLIPKKTEFTKKRRSVKRYTPIFKKITIELNHTQSSVRLEIPLSIIKQSSSIQKLTA
ncbi:MAG: hypothetical protein OEM79_06045 [Nitrosopumilus sp.]|nr:hypothetical protein [Nitrosopumilus sp.]